MLSEAELGAVREVALSGMITPVIIKRLSISEGPYGDDVTSFTAVSTVNGWMYSDPQAVITEVGGVQGLVNTYRLFLPVGTDILSGDQVVIGGHTFICSDTNAESTYLPLLRCTLRRLE